MKHISTNRIISIAASSENPNFPASRLLDEHPKRVWKVAFGHTATLTADVVGGCSDIMLAGTNAMSATLTVIDPNEIEWEAGVDWEAGIEWAELDSTPAITVTQRSSSRSLWVELSQPVTIPCQLSLSLTCDGGETLYAGVASAGLADDYGGRNPSYGLGHERIDYGIMAENSNGSFYYKQRDNVRSFDVNGLFLTEDAIRLLDSFSSLGYYPSAWRLTDKTGNEWVVFGRFSGSPKISHQYPQHSNAQFQIIEVL
jgi:hypothetical protein